MAFSTGLRMKGMILSIHHNLEFSFGQMVSTIFGGFPNYHSEWDNAGIIGCIASDWKKVWAPWNHREESKLEVMPAMYYEAVMESHAQIKLRKWQDWWMAGVEASFWSCLQQLRHHHHQRGSQVWLQRVRVLVLQLVMFLLPG